MKKMITTLKMAALSLTGLVMLAGGGCLPNGWLPDNYWSDPVAAGIMTGIVNTVLAMLPGGIQI